MTIHVKQPDLDRDAVFTAWLDHPKLGCGERSFVVVRAGRTRLRLLATASLRFVTVARGDLTRVQAIDLAPARLARRLKLRARDRRRLGLPVPPGVSAIARRLSEPRA
jgi:hypothetical protein